MASQQELIDVVLTSPRSVVWQGQALIVSSQNSDGVFDLYPDHARFMTLLEQVDLIIQLSDKTEEVFHIERAVLLFQDAEAKIYLHKHIEPESSVEENVHKNS